MSEETTEVKTPSGKVVIIRNYTTRGDDKAAKAILGEGTTITMDAEENQTFSMTLAAQDASDAEYVRRLVKSIDGNAENIVGQLDDLRSDDYDAIDKAVKKVTSVPKATSKS